MRKFSLAYLTIPGIDPVRQIHIARETGYDTVSLRTIPMGLPGEPRARLAKDPALFKEVAAALDETKMPLLDIELARIREDLNVDDYEPEFEKGAELGASQVLLSVWTDWQKNRDFTIAQFEKVCDHAAKYNLTINLEFVCVAGIRTLAQALDLLDTAARPNAKIMVDMFHAFRAGLDPKELAAVPKNKLGIIHLCDAPAEVSDMDVPTMTPIMREGRLDTGEGASDIVGYVSAMPADAPVSIELPNSKEIAELGEVGHAKRCIETARKFFADHNL